MTTRDQNVPIATLRRCAGGRFSEQVAAALSKDLSFEGFRIEIESVELGDNPFTEEVSISLVVCPDGPREENAVPPAVRVLYTFTNESSIEQNLKQLREMVQAHWETAARAPKVERPHSITTGSAGD
jgi:hypothetical protein